MSFFLLFTNSIYEQPCRRADEVQVDDATQQRPAIREKRPTCDHQRYCSFVDANVHCGQDRQNSENEESTENNVARPGSTSFLCRSKPSADWKIKFSIVFWRLPKRWRAARDQVRNLQRNAAFFGNRGTSESYGTVFLPDLISAIMN